MNTWKKHLRVRTVRRNPKYLGCLTALGALSGAFLFVSRSYYENIYNFTIKKGTNNLL